MLSSSSWNITGLKYCPPVSRQDPISVISLPKALILATSKKSSPSVVLNNKMLFTTFSASWYLFSLISRLISIVAAFSIPTTFDWQLSSSALEFSPCSFSFKLFACSSFSKSVSSRLSVPMFWSPCFDVGTFPLLWLSVNSELSRSSGVLSRSRSISLSASSSDGLLGKQPMISYILIPFGVKSIRYQQIRSSVYFWLLKVFNGNWKWIDA